MTELDIRQAFSDHKDAVYGFAFRMTGCAPAAEDIAQDCFLELLRHPKHFGASRGSLRAYLLGVTRNLVLRRWRTERRLDALDDALATSKTPAQTTSGISMLVSAAVQSLPVLQREAVLLFEYEGFTLEEIARITSADVGAVKSRLHRARERLRNVLAPLRNGTRGD